MQTQYATVGVSLRPPRNCSDEIVSSSFTESRWALTGDALDTLNFSEYLLGTCLNNEKSVGLHGNAICDRWCRSKTSAELPAMRLYYLNSPNHDGR